MLSKLTTSPQILLEPNHQVPPSVVAAPRPSGSSSRSAAITGAGGAIGARVRGGGRSRWHRGSIERAHEGDLLAVEANISVLADPCLSVTTPCFVMMPSHCDLDVTEISMRVTVLEGCSLRS